MKATCHPTAKAPHCSPVGFSLIELIAVIAVIGILAAMLLPIANNVRTSARKAQSVSNLHALYALMTYYAEENDQQLPYANTTRRNQYGITMGTWAKQLNDAGMFEQDADNLKYFKILGCPQQRAQYPQIIGVDERTYSMNNGIGGYPGENENVGARSIRDMRRPSGVAVLLNGAWNGSAFSAWADNTYPQRVQPVFNDDSVLILFADGQVREMPVQKIPTDLGTPEGLDFWRGGI